MLAESPAPGDRFRHAPGNFHEKGIDMASNTVEKCANCGRVIGNLKMPTLWRENVVCAECHARLGGSAQGAFSREPDGGQAPKPRFSKPPRVMKAMFWIGLLLWFGPALLCIAVDHPGQVGGFVPLMWLGAILCIGSIVVWAIIVAAKS